jgi:hypothetical protein
LAHEQHHVNDALAVQSKAQKDWESRKVCTDAGTSLEETQTNLRNALFSEAGGILVDMAMKFDNLGARFDSSKTGFVKDFDFGICTTVGSGC